MKTQKGGQRKGVGEKKHTQRRVRRQEEQNGATLTKANEAQGLAADAGGAGRHLPDLLHALDPCALSKSLVEPGVSPVKVEDVAQGGVCRLLHGGRGNVTHSNA